MKQSSGKAPPAKRTQSPLSRLFPERVPFNKVYAFTRTMFNRLYERSAQLRDQLAGDCSTEQREMLKARLHEVDSLLQGFATDCRAFDDDIRKGP